MNKIFSTNAIAFVLLVRCFVRTRVPYFNVIEIFLNYISGNDF